MRPAKLAFVQRPQQLRRAEIVVRHVVRRVGEVDPEADHRRLVADRVDPADGVPRASTSRRSTHRYVGAVVQVVGRRRVGRREEVIDDHDLVAAVDQLVDDGRADEAGAAGHQDSHRPHQFVAIRAVIETAPSRPAARASLGLHARDVHSTAPAGSTQIVNGNQMRSTSPLDSPLSRPPARPACRHRPATTAGDPCRAMPATVAGPSASAHAARLITRKGT